MLAQVSVEICRSAMTRRLPWRRCHPEVRQHAGRIFICHTMLGWGARVVHRRSVCLRPPFSVTSCGINGTQSNWRAYIRKGEQSLRADDVQFPVRVFFGRLQLYNTIRPQHSSRKNHHAALCRNSSCIGTHHGWGSSDILAAFCLRQVVQSLSTDNGSNDTLAIRPKLQKSRGVSGVAVDHALGILR